MAETELQYAAIKIKQAYKAVLDDNLPDDEERERWHPADFEIFKEGLLHGLAIAYVLATENDQNAPPLEDV